MLQDSKAFSGFSVDDLQKAKTFYGDTLGLTVEEQQGMGLHITLGTGAKVFVYAKPDHTPASFTILNFPVDDIDKAVEGLVAKGITMEHYDFDGYGTDEKGIMRTTDPADGPTIAWFKDPAGNILSVLQNG